MKKTAIVILLCMFITVSCSLPSIADTDDVVDIWYYSLIESTENITSDNIMDFMSEYMKEFGEEEGIKVEIHRYSPNDMSPDDYTLKRNLAIETGQADILMGYTATLQDIRDKGDNYSKLRTYDNILENYRNGFALPVTLTCKYDLIDKDVIEQYGIHADDIITIDEYYEYKQKMKESGAKFTANESEMLELIQYYISKNALYPIADNGTYTIDKAVMKKTIIDICTDLNLYYDNFSKEQALNDEETKIIDETSGKILRDYNYKYFFDNYKRLLSQINEFEFDDYGGPMNYGVIVAGSSGGIYLFINKQSTNENKYKLAELIYDDDFFDAIISKDEYYWVPLTNTKHVREWMHFDEDWKYNGTPQKNCYGVIDIKGVEIFNRCFELARNYDYKYIKEERSLHSGFILYFVKDEVLNVMENQQYVEQLDESIKNFTIRMNMMYEK